MNFFFFCCKCVSRFEVSSNIFSSWTKRGLWLCYGLRWWVQHSDGLFWYAQRTIDGSGLHFHTLMCSWR